MADEAQASNEYVLSWIPTGWGNDLLTGHGFTVSYNPNPCAGSVFASDYGGPETALCYGGLFDILNGDFRAAYEKLAPQGLEACKAFYRQQSAHADSSWSSSS